MSTTEELADGLLIHTISHKLDQHTQEKWQEALATDKLPRVSQTQERTGGMTWRHVPSQLNPADILSRGCTPLELMDSQLWHNGPPFIQAASSTWPQNVAYPFELPERRQKALVLSTKTDLSTSCKFNNTFAKLQPTLRQRYWPIGGLKAVSNIINRCVRCFRMRPKLLEQVMAPLPAERVQPSPTFHVTGIDFCGPFYVKSEVSNRSPTKCYISIFICFAAKATHLELVEDLSTFISLRGKPHTIWTDNATNFVGARNELKELRDLFISDPQRNEIVCNCIALGVNWKFIPPRSPHFGGLLEAAVKSAKYHFYRVVGNSLLSFNEFRTLICQISAMLNSRPLCSITENPNDLEILTPGHFIWCKANATINEPHITHLSIGRLSRWQRICHMQQSFWKKWSTSYLSLLQERGKWRSSKQNLQAGSIVLLKEDNAPPLRWPLGRVDSVITGDDGIVRIAIIRTQNGLVKRAIAKIAVLPIETTSVESLYLPTGAAERHQDILDLYLLKSRH
ncbi:uncharacterized protein LOC111078344 [Drosophila obscura]|uniref:uncharacterized protein LOC111078344 n=1 Tax=Drosophila obscura TaxID=7282 RepID=UPI001BB29D31|nr:uncharacterized protein LOC111078344 [Drosophila obscura]